MAGKYSTISGETWDMIAWRAMGNGFFMDKLIQANPQYSDIFIFPAGIVLTIPEVTVSEANTNPPWYYRG